MLPVVAGERATRLQILVYTLLLVPASLAPVILGSVVAWRHGAFSWLDFALTFVAAFVVHSASNLANTYFDFARNPRQDFMVLVRCSPFSDLKTTEDKEFMIRTFSELYDVLRDCVELGVKDGTIRPVDPQRASVVVFCNLVGGIRHGLLTPYGDDNLFDDIVEFVIYGLKAR